MYFEPGPRGRKSSREEVFRVGGRELELTEGVKRLEIS